MEGCPRLPMIGFDSKTCVEPVNLCEKIPEFIKSNYHENGDNYLNECEQMNRLRQNAVNTSMDDAGLVIAKKYYCQLLLLRNRFPMLPETECAVRFTWEDAFQKEDNTFNDIRFEESSILYNIGAMHSRLGANETRKTVESIKNACTHFRSAAACYEKVRDQYQTYTSDLTPDLLTCQVHTLLGQAHETVLEKSLLDQRTASVNAHIAAQIAEYFQMALISLNKPGINSIVSKRFKEWRVMLTYKLSYYLALTSYCEGLAATENKKYGQMVCYFESAVERLKEAWKNAEKISSDKTAMFKDVHNFSMDTAATKHRIAKRDNDTVYFDRVPALSSLTAVQGVVVAKPQPFDCHDSEVSGADIFQKLVPMDAHVAASEYSEEKAKILREIVELTENKNRELETFLRCVQLERFPLNNDYLRLPRELLDCCATAAAQPTMTKNLVASMQQLNSQHHEVTEQIEDLQQALTTIEQIEPTHRELTDLKSNIESVQQMMLQANENNVELHRHMTILVEHLKILSSPLAEMEKSLPIITELEDETNKPKLARLALITEKIETMKKQRELLVNDLRHKIMDDDITKLVLMQRQENHQSLYNEQVKKHQELVNYIKQNCTAQDNILKAFTETNAEIAEVRVKVVKTFETRNRLIQDYITSFKSFPDTVDKANEGIEFYKRQAAKLAKLKERIVAIQAKQIPPKPTIPRRITSVTTPTIKPDPSEIDFVPDDIHPPSSDRPRLKDYLATMKPDSWGSSSSSASRAAKRAATRSEEIMYMPPIPMTTRTPRARVSLPQGPFPSSQSESIPYDYMSTLQSTSSTNPITSQNQLIQSYSNPSNLPQKHDYQPMPSYQQNFLPTMPTSTTPTQAMPSQHQNYPLNVSRHSNMTSNVNQPSFVLGAHAPQNMAHMTMHTQHYPADLQTNQNITSMPTQASTLSSNQQNFPHNASSHPNMTSLPSQTPTVPMNHQNYPQNSLGYPNGTTLPTQPPHTQMNPQNYSHNIPTNSNMPGGIPPNQQQNYPTNFTTNSNVASMPIHPQSYQAPLTSQQNMIPLQYPNQTSAHNQTNTMQQHHYSSIPYHQQNYPSPMPTQMGNYPSTQPSFQTQYMPQYPLAANQQNQQQPQQQPVTTTNGQSPQKSTTALMAKFDPYRPQPLGTYDIPKNVQPVLVPQNMPHQQPQAQQPPAPAPAPMNPNVSANNPQDIYRPDGFILQNNIPMVPSPTFNNVPLTPTTVIKNVTNVNQHTMNNNHANASSIHPNLPEKKTTPITIVDDLLSLALESQAESIPPLNPSEEDFQQKNNIKPVACIQPLSVVTVEEKKVVPIIPVVTPSNVSSTKEPYEDQEKLDQLLADVQRFEKHVTTMAQKTLNGTVPIEVEWKEISDFQERELHNQTCAIGKCNPKLNRFQDLIPYDNSRICLTQNNLGQQSKSFNDYINGSNIGRIREPALLTAQYPLATTIADFWSMIYDQHVNIAVVLVRPDEMLSNVCPSRVGEELKQSFLSITLLSNKVSNPLTNHKILRLQHLQTNQSRTLIWLEHLGWPPKEMPESPNEFLKFIGDVEHFLNQSRNRRSTILATCPSGVSRVGPFFTLFTAIQDINEGRPFPELNKIIRSLRLKRRHIIQDMNQLKFVYEALLDYSQDFLVKRGVMQPKVSSPTTSVTSNVHQLNEVLQTIIEQAKPSILSTPNYDVGPILSTPSSTPSLSAEERSPAKQLSPMEENFNLRPEESHIRPRATRDDFFKAKKDSINDTSDPFNQLDPYWSMRS